MGVLYYIQLLLLLLYGSAGLDKAGKGATHHGAGGPPHGVKFFAEMAAVLRAPCIRSHELRLFQQLYYNDDDDNNN